MRDSMSAPEMPAKEVNPEFGFREASPSVAAAALAALKGGGGTETGRRGRSSGSRQPAAAAVPAASAEERVAAPAAAVVDAPSDADPDAPRRRRRRGGRGRGRTRRDDDTAPVGDAPSEEIGWQEFDDLSQLDGAPLETEFTFEEADAATLAELGLSPETGAEVRPVADAPPADAAMARTPEAAQDIEPAAKPARRRGGRTSSKQVDAAPATGEAASPDAAAPEAASDVIDAPKPTRRRSPRAKPADEATTDAAAPKPARSRATRAKKDDATSTSADAPRPSRRRASAPAADRQGETAASSDAVPVAEDGEPQGIWGRFRSARKPRSTEG